MNSHISWWQRHHRLFCILANGLLYIRTAEFHQVFLFIVRFEENLSHHIVKYGEGENGTKFFKIFGGF